MSGKRRIPDKRDANWEIGKIISFYIYLNQLTGWALKALFSDSPSNKEFIQEGIQTYS